MSDTYFVKYLPVEEEIKEEDQAISLLTNTIYTITKDNVHGCNMYKENWKKVEPFLCSKDIKVGDRATDHTIAPKDDLEYLGGDKWLNDMGEEVNLPSWQTRFHFIKVIGKISSEACVKDGDLFEEDQLGHYYKSHGHVKSTNELSLEKTPANYIIYIKCPWGHFH